MEQKRLFLAIGLSLLILIVWQKFLMPKPDVVQPNDSKVEEVKKEKGEIVSDQIIKNNTELSENNVGEVEQKIETKIVKTPLYEIKISNRGAVFTSFKLKKFNETNKNDSDLKELLSDQLKNGSFNVFFKNSSINLKENSIFKCNIEDKEININDNNLEIKYTFVDKNGIIVDKIFKFDPVTYLIDMDVKISNGSNNTINDKIYFSIKNQMSEKKGFAFEGPSLFQKNKLEQIKVKNIEDKDTYTNDIKWTAIEERYFVTGIIAVDEGEGDASVKFKYNEDNRIIENQIIKETGMINSGNAKIVNFKIYAGPKNLSILKETGYKLDKIVNFGWFDFIAKPCLLLMNFIYANVFSNYGIAIIILTILFKLIFWPLGTKSYKSMNDMKKLQPLVAELKEKYKSDKQKMNQEMMELYKVYKVNPLSGCLPMLVQLPIFFAFYRMLYSAIELRHAPFFGWIQDLSAPDRLFDFSFSFTIPFFDPPFGIPVLTLLMGASMFLQQKMSPPAGDPMQARMMMLMPLFMTVIFVNFSSGLVLYWLVNNLVSIGQQYYVMKKNA